MRNVQLLIVNRQDYAKICSVGEVGEIILRAAGLAELLILGCPSAGTANITLRASYWRGFRGCPGYLG